MDNLIRLNELRAVALFVPKDPKREALRHVVYHSGSMLATGGHIGLRVRFLANTIPNLQISIDTVDAFLKSVGKKVEFCDLDINGETGSLCCAGVRVQFPITQNEWAEKMNGFFDESESLVEPGPMRQFDWRYCATFEKAAQLIATREGDNRCRFRITTSAKCPQINRVSFHGAPEVTGLFAALKGGMYPFGVKEPEENA